MLLGLGPLFRASGDLASGVFPDLFLTVDFSNLSPPNLPLGHGSGRSIAADAIKVYLAFTNNTQKVISTTRPALLLPGMNLLGVVHPIIRKSFRAPKLSAFGLFDVRLADPSIIKELSMDTCTLS
jgi:hypothetical protein